jgi:hypothetical protein
VQRDYVDWVATKWDLPVEGVRADVQVVNNAFRNWGHQFIYDEATLRGSMESAGFKDVARMEVGCSSDPNLQGIENHGKILGNEPMNAFESIAMEGCKPGI